MWQPVGNASPTMPTNTAESNFDRADRRRFPRPPFWLNLLLIASAILLLMHAKDSQEKVSLQFAKVLAAEDRTPESVNQIKSELAELDLTKEKLNAELGSRLKFAESLKSEEFYLGIDSGAKKLRFYYGDTVLREA